MSQSFDLQFYMKIFETIKEMLFVIKLETDLEKSETLYRILKINPAASAIMGLREDELVGRDIRDFLVLDGYFRNGEWFDPSRDSATNEEGTLLNKDGRNCPVSVSASLFDNGINVYLVFIMSDISYLVEARERAKTESRAKSEFLANMSHEIRTPLNAIVGAADLLMRSSLGEDEKTYVELFKRASQNLSDIVNDILDISKIEANQLQMENIEFSFSELIKDIEVIMSFRAREKGLDFAIEMSPLISDCLKGDPTRIKQILFNLIGNSIKFTNKGSVEVQIAIHPDKPRFLHIRVQDTGIGIPNEKHEILFQKFTQADGSVTRNYGGTGLGLAIVKHLIEHMGGHIGFESQVGVGTTFYFSIPYDPAFFAVTGPQDDSELIDFFVNLSRPLRLLLVDDTFENRFLVRAILKQFPIEITQAENGIEAVDKVKSGKFDIVLMDIQMPLKDGISATMDIRNWESTFSANRVPIIALTAHAFEEEVSRCLDAGCSSHMSKPVSRDMLLNSIKYFVQGTDVSAVPKLAHG